MLDAPCRGGFEHVPSWKAAQNAIIEKEAQAKLDGMSSDDRLNWRFQKM
jgi:hypothetical protein